MRWIKFVIILLILAAAAGFLLFTFQLRPVSSDSTKIDVTIAANSSREQVANQLIDAGLIKNTAAFVLYSKLTGAKVLPGPYEFSPSESASDIILKLNDGDYKTVNVTIIEGWRATDMETYFVDKKGLKQLKGFAAAAAQYEGYLFPDTYNVRTDITTDQMIQLLRDNFTQRTANLKVDATVVSIASIVEREAADDADRSAIAAVYLNRLKLNMPLDADPTIQYAKGNWQAVTLSDYHDVISPYNTYLHTGLPPTPISNPGLKSIQATISPDSSDYLYFFYAHGTLYLSKTLQEHEAKIAQYF